MTREHILVKTDPTVLKGHPQALGDGENVSSITILCHPADYASVLAKVRTVAAAMGGFNILTEAA